MGKGDFKNEIQQLKNWHREYNPILFLPSGDPAWERIWGFLEELNVPPGHVWINYDDGDGACYLAGLDAAPPPEKVSYIALFVTELANQEAEETYLLTDQDIPCEKCSGFDEECVWCAGSGVEWLELNDVSDISRDETILQEYFSGK